MGLAQRYRARKPYIFDETGILLVSTRTHARSLPGTRVSELKPFYRFPKVTAIGTISINRVLALMTINESMDGQAFDGFIEKFLYPQLWAGAVVVMDNLPAHKVAPIVPMIEEKKGEALRYLHFGL